MSFGQRVPHVPIQEFLQKSGVFALNHHHWIEYVWMHSCARWKVVYEPKPGKAHLRWTVQYKFEGMQYFVKNSVF